MDRPQTVGALFGMPGEALWVRQLGSVGVDEGHAVTTDRDNNVIAVGEFSETLKLGGASLLSSGGADVYVAKLDVSTGELIWARRFGGSDGDDIGISVAVDSVNNIYIAGRFDGAVDFGGGSMQSVGSADIFLLKLNSSGDFIWARSLGGALFDQATAISVRGNDVVVAGSFQGSMVVNGSTLMSAGFGDTFVYSLTVDGGFNWIRNYGGTAADSVNGVVIDNSGNVVVTGGFSSSAIDFGGGPLFNAGGGDMFLAKLARADGAHLFSKRIGSPDIEGSAAVVVDGADNIFMTGGFKGTLDFGGGPLTADREIDIFIAKYSPAGAYLWAKAFGGTGTESATSVAINDSGDLVIAGSFCGIISFGGAPLSSASECTYGDVFVARFLASDGSHRGSIRAGGTGSERGSGVCIAPDGRVYATGEFTGFAEFGGQALTPEGFNDSYVLALAPL